MNFQLLGIVLVIMTHMYIFLINRIMENEQRHYELRSGSRSRSITPLVQSHVLVEPEMVERHYDLRNQSRERSHTPGEIANSRRSSFKTL